MTAITDDAQANVDFYTGILGLRLVKVTVNFDDPSAYHLYYGDGLGTPGSALTFFPYGTGRQGKVGAGQVTSTGLAIPPDAMGWWIDRFAAEAISFDNPFKRGDEEVLPFRAHDGLPLELIASPEYKAGVPVSEGTVPVDKAIARMHSITMTENYGDATQNLLTGVLGFEKVSEDEGRIRFRGEQDGYLDLIVDPKAGRGQGGHGTVHHIAWRTTDEVTQKDWQEEIASLGYHISPVMDRDYFRSIYFREPGGVLFEIATLGPGFDVDEPADTLGQGLRLPKMYESMRQRIELSLAELRLPTGGHIPPRVEVTQNV
ncbi:MAG: hypothetical protein BGO01_10735 [Armatimonadetes bacterium 55-13]|nr:ring-cleaving dioxygenase [Armatimonadota bacterium]OJU62950.1 MAG: hypothetical protein BGO01_10735 [Armatimonadetes bacterium 55-13]